MYIAEKDMGWFCVLRIGVSDLHHRGGVIGADPGKAVRAVQAGAAGIDMCPAVLAAEYRPLGEHSKALEGHGPVDPDGGIRQDSVVEGQVDAVMIPVKGHRLHIYIGIQQVCAAHLGTGAAVQNLLRTGGQIDPQILDAVLIPTAVGDLLCVDGKRLPQVFCTAANASLATFRHSSTSRFGLAM